MGFGGLLGCSKHPCARRQAPPSSTGTEAPMHRPLQTSPYGPFTWLFPCPHHIPTPAECHHVSRLLEDHGLSQHTHTEPLARLADTLVQGI